MVARPPGIPVREFPGIATPKIPGGNSREFLKFWRELRGIYRSFVFFFNFYCSLWHFIVLFIALHMCTTHDRLTAFWTKLWMTSLTQLFVFIEFRYIFKYWYRKITEQRQNFANSDHEWGRWDNSNRLGQGYLHLSAGDGRCSKEGVLREAMSGESLSNGGGGVCWYNGDRSLPVSLDMWDGWKAVCDIWVDFKTKTSSNIVHFCKLTTCIVNL